MSHHAHFAVDLEDATDPLLVGLDVGSTASRGGVYDATGRPVDKLRHKVPHGFTTHGDGTSVIDPEQVLREIQEILTTLARRDLSGRIGGVALDTFASSLVGVDDAGRALTPCFTYADSRCAPQVTVLREELDEVEVQERTGTRLHGSYLPARLRWLRETDAATFSAVRRWLSLGEYVHLHLLAQTGVGRSTAAWTGLLDRRTGEWDERMLDVAGIRRDQLSDIHDPDEPLAARATGWPALEDAAWYPVITDGFAANVGAGAADERTAVVSAATSGAMRLLVPGVPEKIPTGLWCYRVSAAHSLLGGALNDVGRVVTWLEETINLAGADPSDVLTAEPVATTPTVLPYLTGERSTGWAAGARALFADVTAATTGAQIYRGTMEGVALSYARVAGELARVGGRPGQILAGGRVTQDVPEFLQVLADALGAPVVPVTIKRSTLHGTALIALDDVAPGVARHPVTTGKAYEPVAGRAEHYAARSERFAALYAAVVA